MDTADRTANLVNSETIILFCNVHYRFPRL